MPSPFYSLVLPHIIGGYLVLEMACSGKILQNKIEYARDLS
jgi:hypothetical protein